MALQKNIENASGVVSTYHRISYIQIDVDNSSLCVFVKSYINNTFRNKEKNKDFGSTTYVEQRTENIAIDDVTADYSISKVYGLLKELYDYKDSKDV